MNRLGPRLQQIDATHVVYRGKTLCYFGGCDYFRLSRHSAVLDAIHEGTLEFGLNVAASRLTTGNHPVYERLERELAKFFGARSAVLVSCGYAANLVAAEILSRDISHVFIDEKAHGSLRDATRYFQCPVIRIGHRDSERVSRLTRNLGSEAAPLLLTDGMSGLDGAIAPLSRFLEALPKRGKILVDDAHAAGVLGNEGCGSIEQCGLPRSRFIQSVTLSKALGVYGGAVLGPPGLARRAAVRSQWFGGNTPMPLPFACAAIESMKVLRRDPSLRQRLRSNVEYVKSTLRALRVPVMDNPSPIVSVAPKTESEVASMNKRLLAHGVYPSLTKYPGGPRFGNFRFAISSEHSRQELDLLIGALSQ